MVEASCAWRSRPVGPPALFLLWPTTMASCCAECSATMRSWKSSFTESSARSPINRVSGMRPNLLHYRGWTGQFRGAAWAVLPIARIALSQVLRRKLFWVLYAFGLLFFFMFFFSQYLLAWTESQMDEQVVNVAVFRVNPAEFGPLLRKSLRIDGSGGIYRS